MKKFRIRKNFLAAALILFFFQSGIETWAQSSPTQESPRVEIAELEKAIQLLENPEEARKLAGQLKALVESKKRLLEKETKKKEDRSPGGELSRSGLEKLHKIIPEGRTSSFFGLLPANLDSVKSFVRIPAILLFAFLLVQVGSFLIRKFGEQAKARMLASGGASGIELDKRISTITRIIRKALMVVVWSFAAVSILSELGFDIKPLLAGAGIVGLAVGFGAQNLVRDVISGLFFIFEDRIRVGDVAILNGTGGLVEQVNLRTIVLRGLDGTVHVFPNGAINTLSNVTYEFSYYVFDVGVAYKEDVDRVTAVLKEVGEEILKDEKYRPAILEPLEILGVDRFGDSSVIIKARIKTLPSKQWLVGREMNRRIKKRFDELGIEIPFPHRSLYFGEASQPIRVKWEGTPEIRGELKSIIREVLEETARSGKKPIS